MSRVGLVVPQPLEECVAWIWLPRGRQVSSIFLDNLPLIIEEETPPGTRGHELIDASASTLCSCLNSTAIRDDGDIGVDHDLHRHFSPRPRLLRTAWLVAAISPNSSPKKSSGQLRIPP